MSRSRVRFAVLFLSVGMVALLASMPVPTRLELGLLEAFDPADSILDAPEAEGLGESLGDFILHGLGSRDERGGPVSLNIREVRVSSDDPLPLQAKQRAAARRAVIRSLRGLASTRELALQVRGEATPVGDEGADFHLHVSGESIRLDYLSATGEVAYAEKAWDPSGRSSLVPPLLAIVVAIAFRRPVLALFSGVWSASVLLRWQAGANVSSALAWSLPDIVSELFWPKFINLENGLTVGFVVAMLAMTGVMTRAGGVQGLIERVGRLASSAKRTQLAVYLMGLMIFFDDYANMVLVGSSMRPLADRFRIAREKLAYIVDSTAAPVASLSIFSTWIAFEVSTFSPQLPSAGLATTDGYRIFIETLPFRFYSILTLLLVPMIALMGRDFGPMLAAENRARRTGALVRPGGSPMVSLQGTSLTPKAGVTPRASRALIPLAVFLSVTIIEIFHWGGAFEMAAAEVFTLEGLARVLNGGGGPAPILIGALAGLAVAVGLAWNVGLRGDIFSSAWAVIRSMGRAIAILYLAWMIGLACDKLGTASFMTALVGDRLYAGILPAVVFLLAAAVAFSTGSSWSTMGLLLPLVVGLGYSLGDESAYGGHFLMVVSIAAVLEGSIFGDHCSPISDTTVLSSTATASDHIDHVRTQLPYAVLTMGVALLTGYIPCVILGWSPLIGLGTGFLVLLGVMRFVGHRVVDQEGRAA